MIQVFDKRADIPISLPAKADHRFHSFGLGPPTPSDLYRCNNSSGLSHAYPFILIYQLPDRASGQLVQVVVIIGEDSPGQLQSCLSSDTGTKQNSEQLTDRKRSNTLCKQFFPRQFISSPGIHR